MSKNVSCVVCNVKKAFTCGLMGTGSEGNWMLGKGVLTALVANWTGDGCCEVVTLILVPVPVVLGLGTKIVLTIGPWIRWWWWWTGARGRWKRFCNCGVVKGWLGHCTTEVPAGPTCPAPAALTMILLPVVGVATRTVVAPAGPRTRGATCGRMKRLPSCITLVAPVETTGVGVGDCEGEIRLTTICLPLSFWKNFCLWFCSKERAQFR